MAMAALESESARRAALLLHGLPSSSRQQVLDRLAPAEQARLKPLLTELAEIGVPRSLGQSLGTESRLAPRGRRAPIEELNTWSADDVLERLEGCASGMLAELLRAREWEWTKNVLASLPEWRRRQVMSAMQSETPPLKPAVIDIFCQRLLRKDRAVPRLSTEVGRSLLARVMGWRAWKR
jgi:hypothetical protein